MKQRIRNKKAKGMEQGFKKKSEAKRREDSVGPKTRKKTASQKRVYRGHGSILLSMARTGHFFYFGEGGVLIGRVLMREPQRKYWMPYRAPWRARNFKGSASEAA